MTAPNALLAETTAAQARASAPDVSAWVSANAGAGKTHVLMMRVLRLLLQGTPPERILCLTFTKAAAAEMSNRVFERLAKWTTAPEDTLVASLSDVLGRIPAHNEIRDARQMFARAIETPGGLKVQTIHAFCERVLQRFPLEAGIPPGFRILDDEAAAALRREAIDRTLSEATSGNAGGLGTAIETAVRWAAEDRFDEVLARALGERAWLKDMARRLNAEPDEVEDAVRLHYAELFRVRPQISAESLTAEMANVLSDAQLLGAATLLAEGGKRDVELGGLFGQAIKASGDRQRVAILTRAFLTQAGEPKSAPSHYVSTGRRKQSPAVADTLDEAQARFHALKQERNALSVIDATLSLIRIASRVMQRYEDAKARRAALDYDDLIERTAALLSDTANPQWFHYKLDGGLDHILVDEAQDTSPEQWKVIAALAAEFYSDAGARDQIRTLFAVGDEKQSIYSFQGAAPEKFASEGYKFRTAARNRRHTWEDVGLRLSFRTVEPVLDAVDTVFANPGQTPGLGTGDPVKHLALRMGEAGLVEIWEPETPQDVTAAHPFAPLEDEAGQSPVMALAGRIADTIGGWLANGEMLASQGRPIRAGDVMILVRKRHPFAGAMVRALKDRDIAVAGSDQLVLANQIAIQDLIALGDFLTLPEDDLSLAVVLKSPLFGLDDDDLLKFAPIRKGALWSALLAAAPTDPRLAEAADKLKRLRAHADFAPPFEFYATLLEQDGARTRFLNRLGPDAADAIDEFMNLALTFDDQEPVSLQGFLSWLREGDRKVKRDMEQTRDEVRVMTVHGAKGLEAPIVFLPDTCSAASANDRSPLAGIESNGSSDDMVTPQVWKISAGKGLELLDRSRAARREREREEHNRLLYVAMTRAKDRLYIAGFQNSDRRGANCWYDTIREGLTESLSGTSDAAGRPVWRIECDQTAALPKPAEKDVTPAVQPEAPPEWARTRAPAVPQLTIPLAPSRLAPLDTDETGEPAPFEAVRDEAEPAGEAKAPSPRAIGSDNRFLRGTLTHALLEHLPSLPPETWEDTARGFVETRGAALRATVRKSIVSETLAVLHNPEFAPEFTNVFGPASRAEVPLVAEITAPDGTGAPIRLSGQLDRLWVGDHDILILDYKTNRPPPDRPAAVAEAYILQLAAYRLALKGIYPDKAVRAAILWTDGCRLMEIPAPLLDDGERRLWALRTRRLDGA